MGYSFSALAGCGAAGSFNIRVRRLSENEKFFARSRKTKILTAGIH
jgi:hypothetical protein